MDPEVTAETGTRRRPLQQGVEMLEYYDIMVIGKTGMGKTTTVDKMIIANPEAPGKPDTPLTVKPAHDKQNHKLVCDKFTMWMVSEKPFYSEPDLCSDNIAKLTARLQKLVLCRSSPNPHEKINSSRKEDPTRQCELFSNEATKVRVLDVPGFFGQDICGKVRNIDTRLKATKDSALSNMRKVLRIKAAHNLQIRRVVYFLPEKGVLQRTDQHLILELQIMERHFGRAIFDSMVVIATESSSAYRHATPTSIMYTEEDFSETKHHLQEALSIVFKDKGRVPEPPIEFISLFDTCEDILRKIQRVPVREDKLNLAFKRSFCARCGLTTITEGKHFKGVAYCTSFDDHLGPIPLKESLCHPMMAPKYSTIKKMIGGILHLVSPDTSWPDFDNAEEECIECKKPPGSPGCMKIGTRYLNLSANDDGDIVEHSSSPIEPYVNIQQEPTQPEPVQQDPAQPDQVQQEPAQLGPVQQELVQPDQTQQEPAKPEQVQQELVQSDQTQQEPAQPDQTQQEPAQPDQTQQEPAQPDQVQQEPAQPEPVQQVPAQPDKVQQDQAQQEPGQQEPVQPVTVQPKQVQSVPEQEQVQSGPVQPEVQPKPELLQPVQEQVQPKQVQPEQIQPPTESGDGASELASPGNEMKEQNNHYDVKG